MAARQGTQIGRYTIVVSFTISQQIIGKIVKGSPKLSDSATLTASAGLNSVRVPQNILIVKPMDGSQMDAI